MRPTRGSAQRPGDDTDEYKACLRKKRYETRVEASKAARDGARRKDAPALYAYECQYCGGWHLTHRKPR